VTNERVDREYVEECRELSAGLGEELWSTVGLIVIGGFQPHVFLMVNALDCHMQFLFYPELCHDYKEHFVLSKMLRRAGAPVLP